MLPVEQGHGELAWRCGVRSGDPSEDVVCGLWQRQRFDRPLALADGRAVHVVFQGWRAGGPGPDFQDAIVDVAGEGLRLGGVEVHVRTSGWRDHGHDGDPAYDALALHVVWRHDGMAARTRRGAEIPTLELSGFCDGGPATGEGPRAGRDGLPPHGAFACPGAAAPEMQPGIWLRLGELGEARVLERAAAIEGDMAVEAAEQVWFAAALEALGYTRNAAACARLAKVVPFGVVASLLRREPDGRARSRPAEAEALLMGAAGFLPSQRPRPPVLDLEGAAYAEASERAWRATRDRCVETPLDWAAWRFAGVRPLNNPVRRVAAAIELARPVAELGLHAWLKETLRGPGVAALVRPVASSGTFWERRLDFGGRLAPSPAALVGARRLVEVAVNATIPAAIALARSAGDRDFEEAAIRSLRALPARGDNHLTRRMAWQIFNRRTLAKAAAQEHGLLHVYERWCRFKRCWECPLALAAQRDSGRAPAGDP